MVCYLRKPQPSQRFRKIKTAPMNEMIVAMAMDQPIMVRQGPVHVRTVHVADSISAPEPIGVVAAIAIRPPPKSRSVPRVIMASRKSLRSRG